MHRFIYNEHVKLKIFGFHGLVYLWKIKTIFLKNRVLGLNMIGCQ